MTQTKPKLSAKEIAKRKRAWQAALRAKYAAIENHARDGSVHVRNSDDLLPDVMPWKNWSRLENHSRHVRNLTMLAELLGRQNSRIARRLAVRVRSILNGLQTGRRAGGQKTAMHKREDSKRAVQREAARLRGLRWAEHNLASGIKRALKNTDTPLSESQVRRYLGPRKKRA